LGNLQKVCAVHSARRAVFYDRIFDKIERLERVNRRLAASRRMLRRAPKSRR
jgi:hypothetical protein